MARKTTGGAAEDMASAVAFGNKPTPRAALAGMFGVDIDHSDTTLSSLILDKGTKLPEGPGVLEETLFFSSTNPLPDIA